LRESKGIFSVRRVSVSLIILHTIGSEFLVRRRVRKPALGIIAEERKGILGEKRVIISP